MRQLVAPQQTRGMAGTAKPAVPKRKRPQTDSRTASNKRPMGEKAGGGKEKAAKRGAGSHQSTADIVLDINKLWEKLRSKSVDTDRRGLSEQIYALVRGRVVEMALKHDASRALQAVYARGDEQHRIAILAELKGHLRTLCMSKYGRQVILKVLQLKQSKPLLGPVFVELRGFTRKLLTHKVARTVIDCMYAEVATKEQKSLMVLDCLGRETALLVAEDQASCSLGDILEMHPTRRIKVLARLHELLLTLVQKECLQSQLALHLLCEFVAHASEKARADVLATSASLCEQIAEAGAGRPGELALVHMLSYGGAKVRKDVMKGLKGLWFELAMREHGHRAAMRCLDVVDDTTLLRKMVLADLIGEPQRLHELATSKHGRRVLLHVLAPRDPHFFDQWTIQLMQPTFVAVGAPPVVGGAPVDNGNGTINSNTTVRMVPTSKKEPAVRQRELLGELRPALISWAKSNCGVALCNSLSADVLMGLVSAPATPDEQATLTETLDELLGILAQAATSAVPAEVLALEPRRKKPKILKDNQQAATPNATAPLLTSAAVNHYVGRKTIRRLLDHTDVGGAPATSHVVFHLPPRLA